MGGSKLAVADLFAGAGGFAVAARAAGASVPVSVEIDKTCCETLSANSDGSGHRVEERDVTTLAGSELRRLAGVRKGQPLLVVGGPPCQPFSKASYWTDPGDDARHRRARARGKMTQKPKPIRVPRPDDRRDLLGEFARLVVDSKAAGFVIENVRSILHPRNKPTFESVVQRLEEGGYRCRVVLADSANYGVAQHRQRVFVLGCKGVLPEMPVLTHRTEDGGDPRLPLAPGSGLAIAAFASERFKEEGEEVAGRWEKALEMIPPGQNYKHLTAWAGHPHPLFEAETRFWNFLLKLNPDAPSWTINANPGPWVGPFHWSNRRLRTPELAAIQSFPSGYEFRGNRRARVRQVGNAVPPRMAMQMVAAVLRTLGEGSAIESN